MALHPASSSRCVLCLHYGESKCLSSTCLCRAFGASCAMLSADLCAAPPAALRGPCARRATGASFKVCALCALRALHSAYPTFLYSHCWRVRLLFVCPRSARIARLSRVSSALLARLLIHESCAPLLAWSASFFRVTVAHFGTVTVARARSCSLVFFLLLFP